MFDASPPSPEALTGLRHDPWTSGVMIILYLTLFVMAVVGNLLVLGAVSANPSMHSSVNFLIMNMSVADILMAIVVMLPNLFAELFYGKIIFLTS